MKIGFRVDAARHIGSGHLQRCLTLACHLRDRGHECIFYSRNFDLSYYDIVKKNNFIINIIGSSKTGHFYDEKEWIGVELEQDFNEFQPYLEADTLDICIVDHYSIDENWESQVKRYVSQLMVIDDLANRSHSCDILLDQNYLADFENRYNNLVSVNTLKLLGPTYCLLRDEFSELRNTKYQLVNDKPLISINFGGVGVFSFLEKVVSTINKFPAYKFILITGKLNEDEYSSLEKIKESHVDLIQSTNEMAKIFKESQFVIGACGSTVWERFCLGVNAGLVAVAENQKPLIDFLSKNELIDNLGLCADFDQENFFSYMTKLNLNSELYKVRRNKIMALVDGLGVQRVTDLLLENVYVER